MYGYFSDGADTGRAVFFNYLDEGLYRVCPIGRASFQEYFYGKPFGSLGWVGEGQIAAQFPYLVGRIPGPRVLVFS